MGWTTHALMGISIRRTGATLGVLLILAMTLGATVAHAALPGDEPQTAIPVGTGVTAADSTAMTTSGADPTECPGQFDGPFSNTMWFEYTAPNSARNAWVDVNSFVSSDGSTDFLAGVFVYEVGAGGDLTLVGCNAYPALVIWEAEAGATYLIMVAGLPAEFTEEPELSDRGGTFEMTITPVPGGAPWIRDRFSFEDTFTGEFCGDTWIGEAVGQGVFMLKQGHAGDPTPYLMDRVRVVTTWTDADDPTRSFIDMRNAIYKDLRIEHVEGTVYRFTAIEAGQPWVIMSTDHKVTLHDRGVIRTTFVVDTRGDALLDNDIHLTTEEEWLRNAIVHGPHEGFPFDEDVMCAAVEEAVGD